MKGGYFIETYGCQMNVRDSETLAGMLREAGYRKAVDRESVAFIIYNTCCVREHAEQRVYGNLGALKEWCEQDARRLLAVCGCMMQQPGAAEKLMKRFPFVRLVFGTHVLAQFPRLLAAAEAGERILAVSDDTEGLAEGLPSIREKGVSAFVNINFGCNNFCSYCIVPYVRGRERSRQPEDILSEVRKLAAEGVSEVTLLGQNVNSYGVDLPDMDFARLLAKVNAVEGLRRVRFMTSHPKDLTDGLIKAMAGLSKVCHHVHLPLQSGSDGILAAMNRRYTREGYLRIVDALRAAMPDVEITTDIIVGFPGETEADFADTLELVERVGFASAFTFMYSPRKGTKAAIMPEQIPQQVKRARLHSLNALQERKSRENNERYIGQTGEVLVEGVEQRGKLAYGKFPNFKMLYFPGNESLIGQYIQVRALAVRGNSLLGERKD